MAKTGFGNMWRDELMNYITARLPKEMNKRRREMDLSNAKRSIDKLSPMYLQLLKEGVMGGKDPGEILDYLADSPTLDKGKYHLPLRSYKETGVPSYLTDLLLTLELDEPALRDPQAAKEYYDADAIEKRQAWQDSIYGKLIGDLVILDELENTPPEAPTLGKTWKEGLVEWISGYGMDEGEVRDGFYMELARSLVNMLPDSQALFFTETLMKSGEDTELNLSEHFAQHETLGAVEECLNEFLEDGSLVSLRTALYHMCNPGFAQVIDPETSRTYFEEFERARGVVSEPAEFIDEYGGFEVLDELKRADETNPTKANFIKRMRDDKDSFRRFIADCRRADKDETALIEPELDTWYAENVKLEKSAIDIMDAEFHLAKLRQLRNVLGAGATGKTVKNLEKNIEKQRKHINDCYKKNEKLREKTVKDLDKRAAKSNIPRELFEYRKQRLLRGALTLTPEGYLSELEEQRAREARSIEAEPERLVLNLGVSGAAKTRAQPEVSKELAREQDTPTAEKGEAELDTP